MPNRRLSTFDDVEAVQAWLMTWGLWIESEQILGMMDDKEKDYKVRVYNPRGAGWRVIFERRPFPECHRHKDRGDA